MKSLVKSALALTSLIVVTGCGASTTTSVTSDSTSSDTQQELCDITGLPDGFVVIGHTRSPLCPAAGFSPEAWNTYVVVRAGSDEVVCSDSPIPAGYVKVAPKRAIECVIPMFTSIDYTNAYEIRKL